MAVILESDSQFISGYDQANIGYAVLLIGESMLYDIACEFLDTQTGSEGSYLIDTVFLTEVDYLLGNIDYLLHAVYRDGQTVIIIHTEAGTETA